MERKIGLKTPIFKTRGGNRGKRAGDAAAYAILVIGSVVMLIPLLWMLGASLQPSFAHLLVSPFYPSGQWRFANYADIFTNAYISLPKAFGLSVLVAVPAVVAGSYVSGLTAFAFGKLRFKFKRTIFLLLLGVLMIPYPAIMLPLYKLYANFGWIGTPLPLIVPKIFGNVAMVFFLRQYLANVNDSIIDSAKIDGCGYFRIFNSMILPLIVPALAAQVILWFMGVWNDYLPAYMYDVQTLPIVVAKYNSDVAMQNEIPKVMAASVVSLIPVLIVFVVFQRWIIESVVLSGVKE
ncbi:MAG: carbohydrate ABC transporter permease [Clostridiales bacterium]|jgi:multiple sugar transport system permease protein|nr:carbohydrate ABC transporter permease [Clostridiales bacterium]